MTITSILYTVYICCPAPQIKMCRVIAPHASAASGLRTCLTFWQHLFLTCNTYSIYICYSAHFLTGFSVANLHEEPKLPFVFNYLFLKILPILSTIPVGEEIRERLLAECWRFFPHAIRCSIQGLRRLSHRSDFAMEICDLYYVSFLCFHPTFFYILF